MAFVVDVIFLFSLFEHFVVVCGLLSRIFRCLLVFMCSWIICLLIEQSPRITEDNTEYYSWVST